MNREHPSIGGCFLYAYKWHSFYIGASHSHPVCGASIDVMQEYAESFYKSKQWQDTRNAYASSVGGLCERCKAKGIINAGEIVHHKIHITPDNINDPCITLDWNNLMLVCRDCHGELHAQGKRYSVDALGRVAPHF